MNNNMFNEKGHLNEEGIAAYSDALIKNKLDEVPPELLEHVENCLQCKKEIIELYDTITEINKTETHKPETSKIFRLQDYAQSYKLAAVFTGLIAIGAVLYLWFFNVNDYEQLFADNYSPYRDIVTSRSDNVHQTDSIFNKAITYYYNTGKYDSAYLIFKSLYGKGYRSDALMFYFGNACMSTNRYSQAAKLFSKLSKAPDNLFKEQVTWYLSLAYLGEAKNTTNKKDREKLINKSKDQLKKIIQQNTSYKSRAEKLLRDY